MSKISRHRQAMRLLAELGRRLTSIRRAWGVSCVELAARASVSPLTLRRAERGDASLPVVAYVRILEALGFVDDLNLLGTGIGGVTRLSEHLLHQVGRENVVTRGDS